MRRWICAGLLCAAGMQAQWVMQQSGTAASLRGVHALGDGRVAWASGTQGTVLRTVDGGAHWARCAVPEGAEKLDFRAVQALSEKSALVMSSGTGELSRIYRTDDGCASWRLLFTNPDADGFFDGLIIGDAGRIVLVGDPVVRKGARGEIRLWPVRQSFDGGEHWEEVSRTIVPEKGESIFAASNTSLQALGGDWGYVFVTGGARAARAHVLMNPKHMVCDCAPAPGPHDLMDDSSDTPLPASASAGAFSVAVIAGSQEKMSVVGGDYKRAEDAGAVAAYTAGGPAGWKLAETMPHGYRSAVAYDARLKMLIAVGPNGTDVSADEGKNWRALTPGPGEQAGADRNWNAISLPYVVGPAGRIGRLRDGVLR